MRTTTRCLAILLLLLAGPAATSWGQPARTTPAAGAARRDSTATQRALVRAEEAWVQALVRRDGAAFRRLLAPGFVYTEDDRVMTRDELIREVTVGTDTVEWAGNEDMRVHDFGTAAVVTGWLVVRGRGKDGPFNRRFRYTDTWLRRDGRWRVIAAQDYLAK